MILFRIRVRAKKMAKSKREDYLEHFIRGARHAIQAANSHTKKRMHKLKIDLVIVNGEEKKPGKSENVLSSRKPLGD